MRWRLRVAPMLRRAIMRGMPRMTMVHVPSWTHWMHAAATALRMPMLMGCATMLTLASGRMTRVASATARGRFTPAVVQAFQRMIATARATNWMRWENAEELVWRMPMRMAFAMTSTPVSVPSILVEFATARGLFTNAAAQTFQQRIAIAREMKKMRWASVEAIVRRISTMMEYAMWMRFTVAPILQHATTLLRRQKRITVAHTLRRISIAKANA